MVGVPWVLVAAGTLPGRVPSGADLTDALMSPDDGGVLFTLLTVMAWTLWAWFTLGVLTELPRLVRRRPSRRHRALRAPQRLAGLLLGGLLVLPAGTAIAAPTPAIAATAPLQPATHGADADQDADTTDPAPPPARTAGTGPVHVVSETGETVWDLAVEYLGSGTRAQEIRHLNPHLPDTALLPAGTAIQLPANARIPQALPGASTSAVPDPQIQHAAGEQPISTAQDRAPGKERTHTVRPGESLSSIAQKETGNAAQWPQLYAASKNTDQPDGTPRLSDPDLIYPGQQITIPATHESKAPRDQQRPEGQGREGDDPSDDNTDEQRQDEEKDGGRTGGSSSEGGAGKPTAPARPTPPPATEPGTDKPSTPPSERDTSSGRPHSPSPPAVDSPAPAPSDASEPSNLLSARTVGVLASLAAAVTLALAIRRILQRRRAKPGERIAMPEEVSPTEAQMAQAAEPAGPLRLDRALRTLAYQASRDGQAPPALRGARIDDRSVQILPEDLQAAPAPPFTTSKGGWWVCDHATELLDEQHAQQVDAPYPGLVTIGANEAGHLVLLNLPHAGVILLEGEQEPLEEVLTAMALELGMSPWGTDVEVVLVGFGKGLDQLLPTSRIAYMRESAHAARDFAERLLEAHQEAEQARAPYLILCASPLTADSAWQIAETLDRASGVMQAALITPASSANLLFEQSEVIDAANSEPQRIDILGTDITLQRLQRQAIDEITAALAVSGQDTHAAAGAWQHVPAETQTTHAAHAAAAARQRHPAPDTATHLPGPTHRAPAGESTAHSDRAPSATVGEELGIFPALLAASPSPADVHLPRPPTALQEAEASAAPETRHEAETLTGSLLPGSKTAPAPERAGTPGADPGIAPRPPAPHAAPDVPVIQVLGPVTISGVTASPHGTREAQLAALLHLKPGRSADSLCADMDPAHPWSTDTLNARLGGLRRSLGQDPDGNPYVPRRSVKSDPYTLSETICCDWHGFQHAVEAALPKGPAGLTQLEKALHQVRGRPFGAQPLPWSEPLQQEMAMRIVHVAHTIATHRLAPGPHHNLTLARQAISIGLEVDEAAEILYRTWFQIEAAAGNRSGLTVAISRLDQVNRSLGLPMEIETEQLIHQLLNHKSPQGQP
ncbi:LysM peptidoglycan-binding domain-containing protein [Streptomyces sp. NPDC055099]